MCQRKEGLSKCGRCKQAFYCNVECQKEDWPMHKLECSPMVVFGENWNPSETVRLTARILAKQMHPERTTSEKLLAVKEFESHLDKLDNEKKDLIQSDIAALHHFYSKHLEFPDSDSLVVLFAQVNCNGFTVEDEELSHLGSAIFPDVALMNHSCCPNVIVTYKGTLAEVRAVQEISPGEEVSVWPAAAGAVGFRLRFYRAVWKIPCGSAGQDGLGVSPAAALFPASGLAG
ncbi:N-lysine methyltransferase SMYD2-like isoform X2 [Leptonychotes weddellii]|uniref:[histone H3]-lysine(4) N-trimethyltransferase n=1 Tax=Leptonychotes weddellii TaxID=9713 RepID=A0A7F8PZN7_LEPWE|nr:N-lysine methyltransferase SMYD2-like isoform X2 [Leptonychotes weddellii]